LEGIENSAKERYNLSESLQSEIADTLKVINHGKDESRKKVT